MKLNFFTRVFISMKRNIGKVGVLFVTFTILGTLLSGAISVQRSISQAEDRLWQGIPAFVALQNLAEDFRTNELPALEMLEQIGNLLEVSMFFTSVHQGVVGENIVRYREDGNFVSLFENDMSIEQNDVLTAWQIPRGASIAEFESGLLRLVEGGFWEERDGLGIVISRQLAAANNLILGSAFPMSTHYFEAAPDENPFSWQLPIT